MAFPTKMFDVQSSDYSTMKETLAAIKVAGEYVVHSEVAGFYFVGGAIGDVVTIVTKSPRVKCFKKAAEVWVQGEALYYSATPDVTNVAGALLLIGYASESIAAADTEGFIDFDGFAGFLKA